MSSRSGGVPVKKRRISNEKQSSSSNNMDNDDVDVISIIDDDSSFSSASSAFHINSKDEDEDDDGSYDDDDSELNLKIPATDHSQDTSVGSASPTWNTQPFAASAVKHKIRTKKATSPAASDTTATATKAKVNDKKRKVSMSPNAKSENSLEESNATTKAAGFRLSKIASPYNKSNLATAKATAAAKKKTTKATNDKKTTKASAKKQTAIEKEMELMDPKRRPLMTREEMIASFDDDSDAEDDLLDWNPWANGEKPREDGTHSPGSSDESKNRAYHKMREPDEILDFDASIAKHPFTKVKKKPTPSCKADDQNEEENTFSKYEYMNSQSGTAATKEPTKIGAETTQSGGESKLLSKEPPLGGVLCALPKADTPANSAEKPAASAPKIKASTKLGKDECKAALQIASVLPETMKVHKKKTKKDAVKTSGPTVNRTSPRRNIAGSSEDGTSLSEVAVPDASKSVLANQSKNKVLSVEIATKKPKKKKNKVLDVEAATSSVKLSAASNKDKDTTDAKSISASNKGSKVLEVETATIKAISNPKKAADIDAPSSKGSKVLEVETATIKPSSNPKKRKVSEAKAASNKSTSAPTKKSKAAGVGAAKKPSQEPTKKPCPAKNGKLNKKATNEASSTAECKTAKTAKKKKASAGAKAKKNKAAAQTKVKSAASKAKLDSTNEKVEMAKAPAAPNTVKTATSANATLKNQDCQHGTMENSKEKAATSPSGKVGSVKASGKGTQGTAGSKKASDKPKVAKAAGAKPKPKKMRFDQKILHHMVSAMKPFASRGLAQELKTTEQQLHHTLLAMKDKGLVVEKEFTSAKGKTKTLIWADLESQAKDAIQVDYSAEKAVAANQELQLLINEEKGLYQQLTFVTNQTCNEELSAQVVAEEELVAQLKKKMEEAQVRIKAAKAPAQAAPKPAVRSFQAAPKSAAQLARERCPRRMKIRINAMRQQWKTRKEKCKDFVDTLSEAMEKKLKDVYSLLDVETDEMEGVTMPAKHEVDP